MSMETDLLEVESSEAGDRAGTGFPELTVLGKRIEMLRIERGMSKQALARGAATSRQQLWRVMTGKSELTGTLGQRLAEVLQVDARLLRGLETSGVRTWSASASASVSMAPAAPAEPAAPRTLEEFVTDGARLQRAVSALPVDAHGMQLRRALLDAVQQVAGAAGVPLAPEWHLLRAASDQA